MKNALNILVTSVGRRSYIIEYFKEALKGSGEVHAANSVMTYAMQVADHAFVTPLIYDQKYIDTVLDYCRAHRISAVLSLLDIDLPVLAGSCRRFAEIGVALVVPDLEVTRICNDNWRTFEFLRRHNISVPSSFLPLVDCRQALASGEIHFSLIVKPRWGLGSIGLFCAENDAELSVFYDKAEQEISQTYLKYESGQDSKHSVITQAKLTGEEYFLDVLNDLDGWFLACIANKRSMCAPARPIPQRVLRPDPS